MKNILLLILFSVSYVIAYSHIGGAHASSGHAEPSAHAGSSEHVSTSGHSFSSEHPYESVSHIEEQTHQITRNNVMIYYFLIMNHHTNRYDTISASSKEELNKKVRNLTGDDEGRGLFGLIVIIVCLVIGIIFFFGSFID